jgi:hypothetical protein
MINVVLSRHEAAVLAEIERQLTARDPDLAAALRFPEPSEVPAVEPIRLSRWQRWEWAVSAIAAVVAAALLALFVTLVEHNRCPVDPSSTAVAPAAGRGCVPEGRAPGGAPDPRQAPQVALHRGS